MSMCLDIDSTAIDGKLILWPCHGFGGKQFFAFEKSGQIVTVEEHCVGINRLNEVILVHCSNADETQRWTFKNFDQKVGMPIAYNLYQIVRSKYA